MDVVPVNVSGEDKFIFAAQDLPRQFHTDPVGFLRCDLPRLKRLDEVPAQVRSLVDGVAAGPGKLNVGGLGGAAEGGYQQLSVRLVGIADIVKQRGKYHHYRGQQVGQMEKAEFVRCPVCGNKTRDKIREDTILKNFPLFCPKCKSECLIDVEQLHITVIKAPDAQTQSR